MHRTQAYGTVHMSTNGGISWTPAGASLLASGSTTGCDTDNVGGCDFSGVVSSGDGSTLVAFAGGEGGTEDGYSYTSHDSGATWTRGDTKKVWSVFSFQMSCAIARAAAQACPNFALTMTLSVPVRRVAGDGMKLAAIGRPPPPGVEQGDTSKNVLYTSSDAGHTWMAATQPRLTSADAYNYYGDNLPDPPEGYWIQVAQASSQQHIWSTTAHNSLRSRASRSV